MSESDSAYEARMKALKEQQDAASRARTRRGGLLLVHTGDGKGKTTAAIGMAIRALGWGHRVGFVQFIKGRWKTGEQKLLASLDGLDHVISGKGFSWETQDRAVDRAAARAGWEAACAMIDASRGEEPRYRLVVLDELCVALALEQLPVDEVVDTLAALPPKLSVVVTGRGAPEALLAIADTVTSMEPVKHAYQAGVPAQKGIDY